MKNTQEYTQYKGCKAPTYIESLNLNAISHCQQQTDMSLLKKLYSDQHE